jgi:hypothetical protein
MSEEIEKVVLDGQIWAQWYVPEWDSPPYFLFWFERYGMDSYSNKENKKKGYIHIAPYTIEIELPKGVNLRKAALKSLQNKRKLILSENEIRLNKIDGYIQTLLAIEHKA